MYLAIILALDELLGQDKVGTSFLLYEYFLLSTLILVYNIMCNMSLDLRCQYLNTFNYILIAFGSIFVALGVIGIFIPVLPTTPFLLLAAICYGKGSKKLYTWLMEHRALGKFIRDYRNGQGIPVKSKIYALVILWVSITSCVIFFIKPPVLRVMIVTIASIVTAYILSLKTRNNDSDY
jgi:uncharacterized membrane protein YbaN (DUF454 family)